MISLNAERENPEVRRVGRAKRGVKNGKEQFASERADVGACPQRDVGRTPRFVRRATIVRRRSASRLRLASRAVPASTPGPRTEFELRVSRHLETGTNVY